MIPKYLKTESLSKQGRNQETIARKHINSGAVWFDQYDLTVTNVDENYLIDVKKVITQKSFNISLKHIDKLYKVAIPKTPMLLIYLGNYVIKAIIQRIK